MAMGFPGTRRDASLRPFRDTLVHRSSLSTSINPPGRPPPFAASSTTTLVPLNCVSMTLTPPFLMNVFMMSTAVMKFAGWPCRRGQGAQGGGCGGEGDCRGANQAVSV